MLKYLVGLLSLLSVDSASYRISPIPSIKPNQVSLLYGSSQNISESNGCVSFSVGSGTGCGWMCNYCANSLETNNYYFTDGVCKYESGGCVGNPSVGVQYTCCAN
jgi:hypothetical protein